MKMNIPGTARVERRRQILVSLGAGIAETEELLRYNENVFSLEQVCDLRFPLPDESFVHAWKQYAESRSGFSALQESFPQLSFPIQAGISQTPEYLAATRKGQFIENFAPLLLRAPELLEITIHHTLAGRIPVLITPLREDFEFLVQALSKRNEPVPIPPSMGACMIAGANNWGRIRQYRTAWERERGGFASEDAWKAEMQTLLPRRELYQDRFILLSNGPYSGVPAEKMGLPGDEWRAASLIIRREHECTHYFTRRVFGSMRNNLLDELIADYCGVVRAAGCFHSSWFLRFVGLDDFPRYRAGARLENYRGEPPVSEQTFRILQRVVFEAAQNLEQFDRIPEVRPDDVSPEILLTLASTTLEELAAPDAAGWLSDQLRQNRARMTSLEPQTAK